MRNKCIVNLEENYEQIKSKTESEALTQKAFLENNAEVSTNKVNFVLT